TMRLPNEGRSDLQELIQRVDANVGDDSAEGRSSEPETDEHETVEEPVENSGVSEPTVKEAPEATDSQKPVAKNKAPRAITTNTNGTSTWTFDSATGLLVFGAGTLSQILKTNLTNAGVTPADVKSIQFESGVVAPANSSNLFSQLTGLSQLIDVSNFDTSSVKYMSGLFYKDSALATTLDLSTFDTSNVISMGSMFEESGVTSLDLSSWDVTKVSGFGNMFRNATKLTTLNLSTWGVGRTATSVNMAYMFYSTPNSFSFNLTNFKTTNVTNMSYMFARGSESALDLSSWDVTQVSDFSYMFYGATNLRKLDLSTWGVGRTATSVNMAYMFAYTKITRGYYDIPLDLYNFKTTNVTDMSYMFYCFIYSDIPYISSWDVTKVQTFSNMFRLSDISMLYLSDWNTSGAIVTNMFAKTSKLWHIKLGENIKFADDPSFTAAPPIGTTITSSHKTTAASWQIVGTGKVFNPKGAMVTTTEMYADRTEAVTYVWAQEAVINTISSLTFGTLAASDFFNGNSPLATNMATGSVALIDLDYSTTYNVTVAQTSDWTTDGESATIAKSNLKIKYGTSDLATGASSFWSGTSAAATKSIAFNHDDTKNFSIWLNPSTVIDTALLGKQLESELTWTLSETP
ncbi:BspA family leucine-rich repeat surface protein, partial [Leuconostoc falkenbergense]|uniref:BspA family leucine-rich repeat surface protein n=1 Tax=Leuconostoc falkenbergense TaxID=2766470 RepID=UPI0021A9DE9D